jgi:hypothetical protein
LSNVRGFLSAAGKEIVNDVRRWRSEFGTPPQTCVTFVQLHDKFGADGTVQNMDKKCY